MPAVTDDAPTLSDLDMKLTFSLPLQRTIRTRFVFVSAVFLSLIGDANAQKTAKPKIEKYPDTPVWSDAESAALEFPGFEFIGEYVNGDRSMQVTPAEGKFYLSIYKGGLPGVGWNGAGRFEAGQDKGSVAHEWLGSGDLKQRLAGWKKVDRSPDATGAKPPADAIVLFDGSNTHHWNNGKIENGHLKAGTRTKRTFRDFRIYLEFLVPLKPEPPIGHPHRGNSGVFAVGAYEVQIADTFALDPHPSAWKTFTLLKPVDTWCGSIYGIRAPDMNMCLPPLSWQSMEIDFRAARFENGKKVSSALISVIHNGAKVIDELALPAGTGGGPSGPRAEVGEGPISLQNHGNPNLFRNIWIVPHPATGR